MDTSIWPDPTKLPPEPVDPANAAFVLTCVGWNTLRPGNEGREEIYRNICRTLIDFMQENGLLNRTILEPGAFVADDTAIRVGDLTEDGMRFMKTGYVKWGEKVDKDRKSVV